MFCKHCGKEIMDEAVICPNCGCMVNEIKKQVPEKQGVDTAAKVFMILPMIAVVFGFLIMLIFGVSFSIMEEPFVFEDEVQNTVLVDPKQMAMLFYIIAGCVLIPIVYLIPMFIHFSRSVKNKKPIGIGFRLLTK